MPVATLDRNPAYDNTHFGDLLALWTELRRGRPMPNRQDIPPQRLRQHLGWLTLIDVEPRPRRYRYRLVGSKLTGNAGRDATGCYLDELYAPAIWRDLSPVLDVVATEVSPVRVHGPRAHVDRPYENSQALLLPLTVHGQAVEMILARVAIQATN